MSNFTVNFDVLNNEAEKMSNTGTSGIFKQKQIPAGEEAEVRVFPGRANMNGFFYIKRTTVWINKKPYLSASTFGDSCPLIETIEGIKKGDNAELKALIGEDSALNVSHDYVFYALIYQHEYKNRQIVSTNIMDGCVKMFEASWTTIKKLNAKLSHRQFQNGTPLGIFDRVKGHNVLISKSVKNNKTDYDVMPMVQPTEVDEKYWNEVPDLMEKVKERLCNTEYLKGIIGNYLFGNPMPAEDTKWAASLRKSSPTPVAQEAPVEVKAAPVEAKPVNEEVQSSGFNILDSISGDLPF